MVTPKPDLARNCMQKRTINSIQHSVHNGDHDYEANHLLNFKFRVVPTITTEEPPCQAGDNGDTNDDTDDYASDGAS